MSGSRNDTSHYCLEKKPKQTNNQNPQSTKVNELQQYNWLLFKFSDMFALSCLVFLLLLLFCQRAAFSSHTAVQLICQQYATTAQLASQIAVFGKNMQAPQPWLGTCRGADSAPKV